jgi:hypothetical protein
MILAVMSASLAGGLGGAARAQINPFWSSRFGARLTNEDLQGLIRGTDKLNASPEARPGSTTSWNNPASKAHGTIEITRIYESRGMTCHAIRYSITLPARPARDYNMDWCKTSEGWKVVS